MNYNTLYYNYDLVRTFHFLYTHSTVITTIAGSHSNTRTSLTVSCNIAVVRRTTAIAGIVIVVAIIVMVIIV